MTKPNELTPEQAIERVGGLLHVYAPKTVSTPCPCSTCEALRISLELAKRPYALGEGEREELRECLRIARYQRDTTEASDSRDLYVRRIKALTAALSLASPKPLRFALPAIVPFDPENPRAGWQMEWHANGLSLEVEFVPREPCDWTFSHDEDGIIDEGKLPDDADEFLEALKKLCDFPLASPFTEEEWRWLREQVHPQYYYRSDQDHADAISAKLDAMLAQSSPANRELDGVDAPADNSRLHRT